MSYNIGSLNIRKSLRTEDQNRDFHTFMHGFIRDAKLDIVAFQEIGRKDAMESVLNSLSAKWTGWKGSHSYGSEFAFIWNSNRVSECSKSHTPQIYQNYRSDYRMMRDPYYGRFAPNDLELNTEFRLVNVHLVHGGSDSLAAIGER
ncbi:MAG: hypothetical protein LBC41_11795, partial [Clostridiales bacterium]|nr:hypothetical protein [Clostridiales bacterium]